MAHLLVELHSQHPNLLLDLRFTFVDFDGNERNWSMGDVRGFTNDMRERLFAEGDDVAIATAMAALDTMERKGKITLSAINNISSYTVGACLSDGKNGIYGLKHVTGNMYPAGGSPQDRLKDYAANRTIFPNEKETV